MRSCIAAPLLQMRVQPFPPSRMRSFALSSEGCQNSSSGESSELFFSFSHPLFQTCWQMPSSRRALLMGICHHIVILTGVASLCRHSATKGIVIAMVCTFFEVFNVPVFWPILVMYFIMLFCITMKRQIKVNTRQMIRQPAYKPSVLDD